jgi:hypothetical protein
MEKSDEIRSQLGMRMWNKGIHERKINSETSAKKGTRHSYKAASAQPTDRET